MRFESKDGVSGEQNMAKDIETEIAQGWAGSPVIANRHYQWSAVVHEEPGWAAGH